MRKEIIIIYSILSIAFLFAVEQMMSFPFAYKTLIKISLFIIIPLIYIKISKENIDLINDPRKMGSKDMKMAFLLGTLILLVVLGSYFLLQAFIDLEHIRIELSKIGVTYINFIGIAVYITFFNSFIEEFFFRGMIFLGLFDKNRILAYILSSSLFAAYHIGIFLTWFHYTISAIALIGLFIGGIIFAWLNRNSRNIVNSWIAHIFADIAIVIIGLMLFGMI